MIRRMLSMLLDKLAGPVGEADLIGYAPGGIMRSLGGAPIFSEAETGAERYVPTIELT